MLHSPLFLFVAVWCSVLAVSAAAHSLQVINFNGGVSAVTALCIGLSLLGWVWGHALSRLVQAHARSLSPQSLDLAISESDALSHVRARWTLASLLVLSLVGYFAFLDTWTVLDLLISETPEATFLSVNQRISEEGQLFGGALGRLYVLPVVGLALTSYLAARRAIGRWTAVLIAACFLIMLVSPRRALLLQGVLLSAFVYQETRGGRNSHVPVVLVASIVTLLFAFSQVVLAKSDPTIEGMISSVLVYVAANIPAMDQLLQSSHFENTQVLLNVPYRVVNTLFEMRYAVELDVPFVDVGVYSNTAPYQYYVYKSVGLPGILFISLLLGFFADAIGTKARSSGTFGAIWVKSAILVFVLFSFREFTLITYDWLFFLGTALLVSTCIHVRARHPANAA